MLPAVTFKPERMKAALADGFVLATELADHLASRGVPFREAHEVVGKVVAACLAQGTRLEGLDVATLRTFHPSFGDDVATWLDAERAIERRDQPGAPARKRVQAAIRAARADNDDARALG